MGNNIKQIKNRIKSIDSTLHVTKAMQLVASSKIRNAEQRSRTSGEYSDAMIEAFSGIISNEMSKSVFVSPNRTGVTCYVVIAGDRGLAGGYNNNIFRLLEEKNSDRDAYVIPIGKRSCEYCGHHGMKMLNDLRLSSSEKVTDADIFAVAERIIAAYKDGLFDSVMIISTKPINVLSQVPVVTPVLPLEPKENKKNDGFVLFEPDAASVMDMAVSGYVTSLLCSAVRESFLSELYSRRNSMDSASKNASDMIDSLSLQFNRARQSTITQEITEIVAGAENR